MGGLQARAQGRKCNEPTLNIEWNTLTGRDKRGVIQNYTLHFSVSVLSQLVMVMSVTIATVFILLPVVVATMIALLL